MRTILTSIMLLLCTAMGAQDVEMSYIEGKQLYDAKSYRQAIPKLKFAAEKGHKKAQYRLGKCYDKGLGTKEDDQQAFRWYFKAAEQKYAKAQYEVGKCYKKGEGIEKNQDEAVKYFKLAAAQNNAEAQLALGKCYMKGKGVQKDLAQAKELFKKAVYNEDDGPKILKELKDEAAMKDADAMTILKMIK